MLKAGNEKLQETSSKLDTIGSMQKDLRKRLHGPDKTDLPPIKKQKIWTVSISQNCNILLQ